MVALKMAVDGTLILLDVPPVIGGAWGRRVTDLRYPSQRVSCNMTQAWAALDTLRTSSRNVRSLHWRFTLTRQCESGEPRRRETFTSGSGGGGWKHRSSCALAAYPTLWWASNIGPRRSGFNAN